MQFVFVNVAVNRAGRRAEGVDARTSRAHLGEVARRLDIREGTRMTKPALVAAIVAANRRAAASARAKRR